MIRLQTGQRWLIHRLGLSGHDSRVLIGQHVRHNIWLSFTYSDDYNARLDEATFERTFVPKGEYYHCDNFVLTNLLWEPT